MTNETLISLFEKQVKKTPDNTALLFANCALSYQELNERANQLARYLVSQDIFSATSNNPLIAVILERSPEMVIAVLAVLKASRAYVPINPNYPIGRIRSILDNSGAALALTEARLQEELQQCGYAIFGPTKAELATFSIANLSIRCAVDDIAYVIFTSGSTGKPKGVTIDHRGAVNTIEDINERFNVSAQDRVLAISSLSFDLSVYDIFGMLACGGAMVIPEPESDKDPAYWAEMLVKHDITVWDSVPALMQILTDYIASNPARIPAALRLVLMSGDWIPLSLPDQIRELLPDTQVISLGGATEASIWSICYPIEKVDPNWKSIPYGKALRNQSFYVLDKDMAICPESVPGQLYIGGIGLALCYWQDEEKTNAAFIIHPKTGERLYKTGDLGRYLADGNIEFIGREDFQVKIRGFRIELGEIEAVLNRHASVKEAIVKVCGTGDNKNLAAYIIEERVQKTEDDEKNNESQVTQWQEVFDETYKQQNTTDAESEFNITGWNSSYTGLPLSKAEMKEWLDGTIEEILAVSPQRVLEIGCGTGMILFRVAPHCEHYTGIDLSQQALDYIKQQIDHQESNAEITLIQSAADNFEGVEAASADTVILNSVIQYFPSIDYLMTVLNKAIIAAAPGGSVFIGDVRNFQLFEAFHSSIQFAQADDSLSLDELKQRINKAMQREKELLVDPDFFVALKHIFPQITQVQIQLKAGRIQNEMNCFRYDVTLHLGNEAAQNNQIQQPIEWMDWQEKYFTLTDVQQLLRENKNDTLALRNIPNARLVTERNLAEQLPDAKGDIATLRTNISQSDQGIEPEVFRTAVHDLPYHCHISYHGKYHYSVVFQHQDYGIRPRFELIESVVKKPWHSYANKPYQDNTSLNYQLISELRDLIGQTLPDYMMPAAFVPLESVPLTANGKVDRNALPEPEITRRQIKQAVTPEEEILAALWADLLKCGAISRDDHFFESGGNSLLAMQLVSRVRESFQVELAMHTIFEHPQLNALAEAIKTAGDTICLPPIIAQPIDEKAEQLSFAQQRLWFLDQFEEHNNPAYNIPIALELSGKLDIAVLEQSLRAMAERHISLRSYFTNENGTPKVKVKQTDQAHAFQIHNLCALDKETQDAEVIKRADEHAATLFDLAHDPLFNVDCLLLAEQRFVLLLNMHHIISDGWSMAIFLRDWQQTYTALSQGKQPNLPDLSIQYSDYAIWQRSWLQGNVLQRQMDYWKKELADSPVLLELPADKPRPARQSYRGAQYIQHLSFGLSRKLEELSQSQGVTLFMTLISVFNILLSRYSGQDDINVGSPIAGRTHSHTENLIGFFVNTLVLRTKFSELTGDKEARFTDLLYAVRNTCLSAYGHQDIPFEMLVEQLQPVRSLNHNPLFQVMFVLQNNEVPELALPDVEVNFLETDNSAAKFDIVLSVEENRERLLCRWEYATDLFEKASIVRMAEHYQILLEGIVSNPAQAISHLPMLTEYEQQQILAWNDTAVDVTDEQTLIGLFEQQVEKTPENTALIFNNGELSYRKVNEKANQLAHYLLEPERDKKQGSPLVAIALERSTAMIIAVLAVLKTGRAYVPIDPDYPVERIQTILDSSGTELILTESRLQETLQQSGYQVVCPNEIKLDTFSASNLFLHHCADDLAYIIFTSGSTGQPKGVTISHRNAVNTIEDINARFNISAQDRVLAISSLSFDLSVYDVFGLLSSGGGIIIPEPEAAKNPALWAELMQNHRITLWNSVPALMQLLTDYIAAFPETLSNSLRLVMMSGDWIPLTLPEQIKSFWPEIQIISLGGATEGSIWSIFYPIEKVDSNWHSIPYGKPLRNQSFHILDKAMQACPISVSGELYIGGMGVAQGYWKDKAKTEAAFIKHPKTGERLYKTGDLGRYLPDGNIEFLGRNDFQVKIRGFRIELGEIEAVLNQHPEVKEAVVNVWGTGNSQKLAAYIIGNLDTDELKILAETTLPDYMVPGYFIPLDELPLTANGKVDRQALPEPKTTQNRNTVPTDAQEKLLANLWMVLLNCGEVKREDNFFDLGGNSLLAMQLISRIRESFQLELPVRLIFEHPQLFTLTHAIKTATGLEQLPPITVQSEENRKQLSFAQQRLWFLDQFEEQSSATYNIPLALELAGELNREALEQSLHWLLARHTALRACFETTDGKPQVKIHAIENFTVLQWYDLSALDAISLENEIKIRAQHHALAPFDLAQGPLFKADCLLIDEQRAVLLLNMHHSISDGWSLTVFINEWQDAYTAFSRGENPDSASPEIEYTDYAIWQRNWLQGEVLQQQTNYWKQQLADIPELIELPVDRPRSSERNYQGITFACPLSPELSQKLAALSQEHKASLFMTLLAAFNILLSRYSRQDDLCVGSPIANRTQSQIEGLMGFFVNTLVLRTRFSALRQDGQPADFIDLLRATRQTCLSAYAHQDIPFEMLVEQLQPTRSTRHSPLFQVMFALQDDDVSELNLPDLEVSTMEVEYPIAKFDLTLTVEEKQNHLVCLWEYATDIFELATITRLSEHFEVLLQSIAENPQAELHALSMLTEAEVSQFKQWNDTASPYSQEKTLTHFFETQVEQTPDHVAVIFENQQLSYRELNTKANQLAHYLIKQGVQTNTLVGICIERSPDMFIALLSILKAGGAYVPLDPNYPQERLRFMLEDSGMEILLTQTHLQTQLACFSTITMIDLNTVEIFRAQSTHNPVNDTCSDDLAYVIYRSGSTDKPKGVCITHKPVALYCLNMLEYYQLSDDDNVLQFAPISFDASVEQIFSTWLGGATLIPIKDNLISPLVLAKYLAEKQVSIADIPPAYWQQICDINDEEQLNKLRILMLGGEVLPVSLARLTRQKFSNLNVINRYGPTETIVTATAYPLPFQVLSENCLSVPIGKPLANIHIYILDVNNQIQPTGIVGELCVGGVNHLAKGYLNHPELTAEKFIEIELPGKIQRIYKTGDLAKWLPDGNLEYIGRIDDQIQLRGFRIESSEIETALTQHKAVKEAVVILYEQNENKQLVAYLTLNQSVESQVLRLWLKEQLPEHMIPAAFMTLDKLPLTSNGKIDRKALPVPELQFNDVYEVPHNTTEQQLAQIWGALLQQDNISIHDNFFELGGDSILSIQVVAHAHQHGLQLTARDLFEYQTIAELATAVKFGVKIAAEKGLVQGEAPLTPIQEWFFAQDFPEYWHFNQSILLQVPMDLDSDALRQAFNAVLLHHDALRLRYSKETGLSQWQQSFSAVSANIPFVIEEMSQSVNFEADLYELTQRYQSRLNISEGPIAYLVLCKGADRSRLFWCIHHLVVDGVSWRILQEDLHTAYTQTVQNQAVKLPAKTSSFKAWSEQLQRYFANETLEAELHYWQNLSVVSLPIDNPTGKNQLEYQQEVTISLGAEQTDALLRQVPVAYNTRINDILLTALALALHDWTGKTHSLVDLEGHGRVDLFEYIDLSRTVGWFTNIHPVELKLSANKAQKTDLGAILKAIKEQLHTIPNDGISYGLLSRPGNQVLPESDILFNYLGQFDQGIEADLFQSANETTANDMSLKGSRKHLIDINGAVIKNRLSLTWSYSSDCYQEKTIRKLAQSYKTHLQQLIQHCQKGRQGVTASDFPLVSLSQTTLDTLYQQYKAEDIYPLSPMQQGLLFHALYESETGAYFEQLQFTLNNLDPAAYKAAWQLQLERHPILRSVFVTEQNQILQIVPTHAPLLWKEHDWQAYSATRQQEQLAQLLADEREQGFDLTQAPLMRFDLIHIEQQRYIFIQHSHHIITDGWCIPITLSEVRDSYLAFKRGQTPQLPRLRPYRDYIAWLQQQDDGVAQEYWRQCLSGFHSPTTLAILEHETEQPDYQEIQYEIDRKNTQQLQQVQKNQRVTLNTLIQAAWALLLSRYSQETDVCFGVTVSGRNVPLTGIEQMMGLLINTLPLRIDTHPDILVKDYLQQVQTQHQDNNHHAHKALFEIQNFSEIPNGISLFDTLLAFESYPLGDTFEQIDDSYEIENMSAIEYTNYPLTLMVVPGETLLFRMVYDSNRIDLDKLDRLWGHFNNLLNAMTKHPEHTISSLAMLTEAEHHQLQSWNDTAAPTTENTLLDLFEQQAQLTPDNIALICEDEQLTYQQVNQSANQLANYLLECHLPLKPLIAVVLERSMQMIVSVLAVLKAGGTYIPIDPDYPAERIQRTLETSGAVCLLTHQYVQEKLSLADSLKVVFPNKAEINAYSKQNPGLAQHPDNIAYIIFTSGSTGMPKGVVITHRSAVNTIEDINERFEVTASDRVLALSSLSFDLSVYDIFGLLAAGGAMVIPPNQFAKEPSYWVEMIDHHKVTLWNTVPALMQIYTDYINEKTEISAAALRLVMMSGDWIPLTLPKRIHALYPHTKLISLGGATEASIWSIYYPIENVEPHWKSIPYGKPLRNQSFHILDASLKPCPLFVSGYLYIGGIGLAQEYWRDTEKTQASFITHPRTGKRLYKTGDLGRYLADGNIEFIGRDDFQVKIRGFRIELGDIEAAISKHPEVQDVTVIVQEEEQNNQRLLAYFVPQSPNNSDTTKNDSQVAQWQEVFEGIYKQEDSTDIDAEFNITGWNSSYTGLPISKAETKIWLDDTIEKILAVSPQRALEIGCGKGMILFRIAPHCQQYTGVDFAQEALDVIQQQINRQKLATKVMLQQNAADNFKCIEKSSVDTVIINSVIQYFPSIDYLVTVLEKAMATIAYGGTIFIGDVRNFQLLEAFHASIQFYQAEDSLPLTTLKQRIQTAVRKEEELLIDPEFFHAIKQVFPRIKQVQIQLKAGEIKNEMNRFRYDVTLQLDNEAAQSPEMTWIDWQKQERHIVEQLAQSEGTVKDLRTSLAR